MIMTSREFNQQLSKAQRSAMTAPVIITKRGEPAFVLLSYKEYTQQQQARKPLTITEALCPSNPAVADIELEIKPRSKAQRRPVEF